MLFPPTDRGGATRRDGASDTRTVGGVGPGRRGIRPSRRQGERPSSGVYVHRRPERPPMKADRQARRGSACSSSAAGASGTRSGRRSPSTTRCSTNYTLLRRDVEEWTKVERGGVRGWAARGPRPFSRRGGSSNVMRPMKRCRRAEARPAAKGPIELDEAYLRAVRKIESLPQNRSGADKSWVERAIRRWRDHYARAR